MPAGTLFGMNIVTLSVAGWSTTRLEMVRVPSLTSRRLSGHATDGSAMTSPAEEICAYQS